MRDAGKNAEPRGENVVGRSSATLGGGRAGEEEYTEYQGEELKNAEDPSEDRQRQPTIEAEQEMD